MASTTPNTTQQIGQETADIIRWRAWPLVDQPRRSWWAVAGMFAVGGLVWYAGGGWLLATAAVVGLFAAAWQFLLPVGYEINSLGLRRYALGRTRLIPWHAVRAYGIRATGVVLYQRTDPMAVDLLRSLFVPYPDDEDEMLCALREHVSHAMELPPAVAAGDSTGRAVEGQGARRERRG